MNDLVNRLNQVLKEYIKPATYPIAVKVCQRGRKIPIQLDVNQKDLNNKITIYQAMSITRRYGWNLAFDESLQACPLAWIIAGYAKDGKGISLLKGSEENLVTMVFSPLDKVQFIPDLVIVYGNEGQVENLIAAALSERGGYTETHKLGYCFCRKEAVIPYINNCYRVIVSNSGENFFTFVTDNEKAFALPFSKAQSLVSGIIKSHTIKNNKIYNFFQADKHGYGFPNFH